MRALLVGVVLGVVLWVWLVGLPLAEACAKQAGMG
jgi:hypothetical protein